MDNDEALLREKATLLLRREREIWNMRARHERASAWLNVALSLPELVAGDLPLPELLTRVARALVSGLKLQKVLFFARHAGGLATIGAGSVVQHHLGDELDAFLNDRQAGSCNAHAEPAQERLANLSGLHRYMWCDLDLGPSKRLFMMAGFTRDKSPYYPPFTEDDSSHFENAGRHLSALLKNLLLVRELEQDKTRLAQFADTLELRVAARTHDLAKVNDALSVMLSALREKDEHIRADLEQACLFQQSILPVLPRSPLVSFATFFQPLGLVGGDIFDIDELERGRFRVFVADATGHGVQASMRTVVLKLEYDRLKRDHRSPATLLAEFNRRLITMYPTGDMVCTSCCFDIDLRAPAGRLVYANAAHPGVLRVTQTRVDEIYQESALLGLMPWDDIVTREVELAPGDLLMAYTDGISEQRVPSGALFGVDVELARAASEGAAPDEVNRLLIESFERFRGAAPITDDIALVTARVAS